MVTDANQRTVTDPNRPVRQPADWHLALLADAAARADSLAGSIASEALDHPNDDQLAAWCGLADRIGRDLDRLLLEFYDTGPTIELRSRRAWGDAA